MSTDKTFEELFDRAKRDPEYWDEVPIQGFIYSVESLLRKQKKKKAELAELAGMPASVLSRALSGAQNITIETMTKIATALDAVVYIHVESREVQGAWVPVGEMLRPHLADQEKAREGSDYFRSAGDTSGCFVKAPGARTVEVVADTKQEASSG